MRTTFAASLCFSLPFAIGCGGNNPPQGDDGGRSGKNVFLDEKKEIGPRLEWNREIASRFGGPISIRVASQGPFAVTLIAEKSYKALMAGNKKGISKQDVLLTVDVKNDVYEGKVTLPAGSSWFIIENQSDRTTTFHLTCSEEK